ncbi:hypothetical protein [Prosthecobacter sp.]|uniref:hypothetical protein n=1 Tax=Prosthecobacter sp. TaxID=1965333 RepID=UPI0037845C73
MRCWIILLASCLVAGCASETKTKVDDFWRWIDPLGHTRSHRESYYPHERTTGLRLPGSD